MPSQKLCLEISGSMVGDVCNREPGSIAGNDTARLSDAIDARHQLSLRLQLLKDGLDNPVALADPLKVVFDIADRYRFGGLGRQEGRRRSLLQTFERGRDDTIAHLRAIELKTALLFIRRQLSRRDVQKIDGDSGVRRDGRDAAAHRP